MPNGILRRPFEGTSIALPRRAVHVWHAKIPVVDSQVAVCSSLLDTEEEARAARFYFERDRRCYVLARGLLRTLLGQYAGVHPAEIRFRFGPCGKPELAAPEQNLRFNLSHAGEKILLAFARGRRVGIDVERIRRLPDAANLAERFFSDGERAAFARVSRDETEAAFFATWTRKEAFIKALGEGLSHPLADFDVPVEPGSAARLIASRSDPAAAERWRLVDVDAGPGYAATLAVEGHDWDLKYLNGSVVLDALRNAPVPYQANECTGDAWPS